MEFRRAFEADYAQIVDLQLRNLDVNLPPERRSDGFLSGYFTELDLGRMNEDLCALVCAAGTRVAGFIGLSTLDFNRDLGMPGAMVACLPHHSFDGRPILEWALCFCGPVCIEAEFRGTGLFERLYENVPRHAPAFDLAVTAVATENLRSLRAHEKVGLRKVFEFAWRDRTFACLARVLVR